jgi:hypothetical protein
VAGRSTRGRRRGSRRRLFPRRCMNRLPDSHTTAPPHHDFRANRATGPGMPPVLSSGRDRNVFDAVSNHPCSVGIVRTLAG